MDNVKITTAALSYCKKCNKRYNLRFDDLDLCDDCLEKVKNV